MDDSNYYLSLGGVLCNREFAVVGIYAAGSVDCVEFDSYKRLM